MNRSTTVGNARNSDGRRLRAAYSAVFPNILFGLRLWASVSLALLVAYWLQLDNPFWAGTSAGIVCQPSLGASLRKGQFRAIGTIIGVVMIVLLTSAFPQSRFGFLGGLTIWCGICGFLATILRNFAAYAAALAGYTTAIVFADAVGNPGDTFNIAVTRGAEICIGVLSAQLILTVTDFGDARRRLAHALGDAGRNIAAGLSRTLSTGQDLPEARTARRELIRQVIMLDGLIDEVIGEAWDNLRSGSSALQASVEGLFTAVSAWRGVANHLDSLRPDGGMTIDETLREAIAAPATCEWLKDPLGMLNACGAKVSQVLTISAPTLSARFIADGVAGALRGLERTANGLVLLTEPGGERPDRGSRRFYVPDLLPAVVNGLRVVAALLATELFWIATDWSVGQSMITFTAIAVILFSPRSDEAYLLALGYALGTVITAGLAAIVSFAVLPALDGFLGLSLVLAAVMVPLGAISTGPWHKSALTAMVTLFLPLLAPTNPPSYDPGTYFNSALAIVTGTIVATISLRLIPPLSPAWRTRWLLNLTLRDLRRLAIRPRRLDREGWVSLLCRRLAAMPKQATLEDAARLVAVLSAGEAIILLRDAYRQLAGQEELDHALRCLATADIDGARKAFALFCARQPAESATAEVLEGMRARIAATVITEALARHAGFFASAPSPAGNATASVVA
ncbi:MAG: FUSC family protein [Dongiaceae bacterium]